MLIQDTAVYVAFQNAVMEILVTESILTILKYYER